MVIPVGRVSDLSGNGKHLLQATASKRPIYRTSGGHHWLEFDGGDDYLQASISISANSLHAYAAFRPLGVGSVYGRLVSIRLGVSGDFDRVSAAAIILRNSSAASFILRAGGAAARSPYHTSLTFRARHPGGAPARARNLPER
jgi:hypothetical protein